MSNKFKFRLAAVLRIRKHQEQLQKQAFAKVVQKKVLLEDKKAEMQDELGAYVNSSNQHIGKNHFEYIQTRHVSIFNLKNRIKKADAEVERERMKLLEARKKTMALENLESKQKITFMQELDRSEQIQMNEIATQRFNRERG
ncbi:hypothetical protein EP331_08460 [bacterium]|nr:MAG: hypothetical protein EP331_08460 [bacterium]